MKHKINCILLIDDNENDLFFHQIAIEKAQFAKHIISKDSAKSALEYLKNPNQSDYIHPNLIFLDINMPITNGWEFLDEYKNLDPKLQSDIIYMLSSTENPLDLRKVLNSPMIKGIFPKPLTKTMLLEDLDLKNSKLETS